MEGGRRGWRHSAYMEVQSIGVVFSTLGTVLSGAAAVAAVMVARWQIVFTRRVALEAASMQKAVERETRVEARRNEAWTALLRAADAFVDTVWALEHTAPEDRVGALRVKSEMLTEACAGLRVLGPDHVVRHAERMRELCSQMERYAVKRAVVRSAMVALEREWCPGNAEACQSDAHTCAWLAHGMLEGWGSRDGDQRPDDLEYLEYLIKETPALNDAELARLLVVARNPVCWDLLASEERWLRPRTGFYGAREAFTRAVCDHVDQSP